MTTHMAALLLLLVGQSHQQCQPPYLLQLGFCLSVGTPKVHTWCSANRVCSDLGGGSLASNLSLLLALNARLITMNSNTSLWIGATDLANERGGSSGGWRLILDRGDFPASLERWGGGGMNYPKNLDDNQDCVYFSTATTSVAFMDSKCYINGGYLCQQDTKVDAGQASSGLWRRVEFARTQYHSKNRFCSVTINSIPTALQCLTLAQTHAYPVMTALHNARLSRCIMLEFTDAQVESEIENDPNWVKYRPV